MRGIYLVFAFVFLISLCSAVPNITLQKENYQPYETMIGAINGVNIQNDIGRQDLKIYDGRREIAPERDVIYYEGTFYFYVIISQEGEYSINISNILYNDSGVLKSASISKMINLATSNKTNQTQMVTIRPGFYYGTNPQISITNAGELSVNVSHDGITDYLLPGELKKVNVSSSEGLSYFNINTYEKFSVPIIKFNFSSVKNIAETNVTNPIITKNETATENRKNLSAEKNVTLQIVVGKLENYSWKIVNNDMGNLSGLEIRTDLDFILDEKNISFLENQGEISLSLNSSKTGIYYGNVSLYSNGNKFAESEFQILVFPDDSSKDIFREQITNTETEQKTCAEFNGTTCSEGQNCNGGFVFLASQQAYCCLGTCEGKSSGGFSSEIIFGLIILVCLGGIGYVLYKQLKKKKEVKPEEKFEQAEKNYQKKISGN